MEEMFKKSCFNQDISDWKPKAVIKKDCIFKDSRLEEENRLPYWAEVNIEFLSKAILAYELQKQLSEKLALKQVGGNSPVSKFKA